ncbi:MAG: cysteine synthase family protein [Chloroflexota bacterium]|nr:cysteine synthase family protein [Chloroflexota bacterium]
MHSESVREFIPFPNVEVALERALHVHGNGHHRKHGAHDHHAFLHQPVSILERVGDTPLLKVRNLGEQREISSKVEIYAKAEWFNPGGSVKDRPGLRIIEEAERKGLLTQDKILIDSTSGNTGIAYAWIGAAKGYQVALVMPENVSEERKKILRAYGAELILTDPLEGADGAIRHAREVVAADPERYYYANQYDNDANWQAHYLATGPEIWAQTEGRVTHFVAGVGTSGTMMGTGRFLRCMNPSVRLIGVQPEDELSVIEGLKHMESAILPAIYKGALLDETRFVRPDQAFDMTKVLSTTEGWFVGYSAGAAMHAALDVAQELDEGVIVAVLPDGGAKYLSLM